MGDNLEWRIRLFLGGGALAFVGVLADRSWVVWCALVVLVIGFFLRFKGTGKGPDAPPPDAE